MYSASLQLGVAPLPPSESSPLHARDTPARARNKGDSLSNTDSGLLQSHTSGSLILVQSNSACFYSGLLPLLGSFVRETPAGWLSWVPLPAAMAKRRRTRFAFDRCGCFGGQARAKMAEDDYLVKLHIYDLSQGMARQLSTTILGKAIDAIWHTGVVVYGKEYFFGGGIQQDQPGRTPYGTPVRVEDYGVTHVPKEVFEDFLQEISPRYTPATYNLLSNNCNNFSNEALQFLVGSTVPNYILDMPNEVMNSPIGALILPMIQGLETTLRAGAAPQPPQFRPAPAAATQTHPSLNNVDIQSRSTVADKTTADKTTGDGSGIIIPPAVQPAPAAATQTQPSSNSIQIQSRSTVADKTCAEKTTTDDGGGIIPPAVQPAPAAAAAAAMQVSVKAASPDPLREAKNRAQEEIKREFAAIMATGGVQAGEAATLATRRVMERHGLRRAAAMQRG